MPSVVRISDTLRGNIDFSIKQIIAQTVHAKSVKGRARSGYYKVAILLAAAIAEALAHTILKEKLDGGVTPPPGAWECYECHDLPPSHQPTTHHLSICKRRRTLFQLTYNTDFIRANEMCRDLGIFSNAFYKKMERVRTTRNRIHLQSLSSADRSYNKKQLDSISNVVNKLIDKVS